MASDQTYSEVSAAQKELVLRLVEDGEGQAVMELAGKLNARTTAAVWERALVMATSTKANRLLLSGGDVTYCDESGVALMLVMRDRLRQDRRELRVEGLAERWQRMLDRVWDLDLREDLQQDETSSSLVEEIGYKTARFGRDTKGMVHFVGELITALLDTARAPARMRWRDAIRTFEMAGVDALPIVALIGFIIGLVMAFQAAVPMRQFGVEIYVADLIALSMLRELGPLMTGIILAGRSGSAFAAELGTMQINEEISALQTMGLDPMRFLVVPRVVAATFVTPLLVLFANLVGLIGGAVVLLSLGYPLIAYFYQVVAQVNLVDLFGGLTKAVVFGFLVSAVGCMRGLQTSRGASGVGLSTTRAVVSAIVLIAIADGVFSVLFYYLGI